MESKRRSNLFNRAQGHEQKQRTGEDLRETQKLETPGITECGRGTQGVILEDKMEVNIHNSQHLHLLHLLLGTECQKPGNHPLLQGDISWETYQALVSPSNWKCDTLLASPNLSLDPPTEQEW